MVKDYRPSIEDQERRAADLLRPRSANRFLEARITVNGTELTEQQSATLRVALTTFQLDLGVLKPGIGASLSDSYNAHIREILKLIGETTS